MPSLHEILMSQDCELPDFYACEDYDHYLCQMEDDD